VSLQLVLSLNIKESFARERKKRENDVLPISIDCVFSELMVQQFTTAHNRLAWTTMGRSPETHALRLAGLQLAAKQFLRVCRVSAKSISSGGLHMSLYSKIWRFGAKIHLQQSL
jgi:hypothetical protein